MDDMYLGYMVRTEAIENIIEYLSLVDDPDDESEQEFIQEQEGIWFRDMTSDETNYIIEKVNRNRRGNN